MFMDLSLAFDTLNHNLLLAKLNAYGFSFSAMKVVQSYLSRRFPRVNLNSNSSKWCKILLVVPQRSYLGPLLFNIFINDVFLFFPLHIQFTRFQTKSLQPPGTSISGRTWDPSQNAITK